MQTGTYAQVNSTARYMTLTWQRYGPSRFSNGRLSSLGSDWPRCMVKWRSMSVPSVMQVLRKHAFQFFS